MPTLLEELISSYTGSGSGDPKMSLTPTIYNTNEAESGLLRRYALYTWYAMAESGRYAANATHL